MTTEFLPDAFKYAPWSYTKAVTAHKCPHAFHRQYIHKERAESLDEKGSKLIGNVVHTILELVLLGGSTANIPNIINVTIDSYQLTHDAALRVRCYREAVEDFVKWLADFAHNYGGIQKKYIEHKMAITADFKVTNYGSANAFYRGKSDLILVTPRGALVVDHKTGADAAQYTEEYKDQLEAYSLMLDAVFPKWWYIGGAIHCVGSDPNADGNRMAWTPVYEVEIVRTQFRESVVKFINRAVELIAMNPPPVSCWKCDYCDYRPTCSVWT